MIQLPKYDIQNEHSCGLKVTPEAACIVHSYSVFNDIAHSGLVPRELHYFKESDVHCVEDVEIMANSYSQNHISWRWFTQTGICNRFSAFTRNKALCEAL